MSAEMNKTSGASRNETRERRGPPLPAFLFRFINPMMRGLLSSPLHKGMSKRLLVLDFTGLKSGKKYSIPVGYVRKGNTVTVVTRSGWWKNLAGGRPVQVRIQGHVYKGTARIVHDPVEIKQTIGELISTNGEDVARRLGYWIDNLDTQSPEAVQLALLGTFLIKIELAGG